MKYRLGSLFAGMGGIDVAFEKRGKNNMGKLNW